MNSSAGVPEDYDLTVITVTRGRPALLKRALFTVADQDYPYPITHLVVVDDDADAYRDIAAPKESSLSLAPSQTVGPRKVRWHFAIRQPGDRSGPPILGRLRNSAARMTETLLIAFLDDDNLLERHHFSSLLHCMLKTGCTAVHSQRRLLYADGRPYIAQISPWRRDIPAAAAHYAQMRRHCIFVPWSNVVRDQVQHCDIPNRADEVDTSEWLFTREQVINTPFGESFSKEDWVRMTGEDVKLLSAIVKGEVSVASSHMPTLHYYLGGMSSSLDMATSDTWRPA